MSTVNEITAALSGHRFLYASETAGAPEIASLVLVTGRSRLGALPTVLAGKSLEVVSLAEGAL